MLRALRSRLMDAPLLKKLKRDDKGVAAVEFAMLVPAMLALYFGGVELSQVIAADRKTTLIARTLSDLVSQGTVISDQEMTNIMNATIAVATPYPVSNLRVIVSSINVDNNRRATVAWSESCRTSRRPNGQVVTLPNGLDTPNQSLILAEVQYQYTPTVGYVVTGPITVSDRIYMRPRLVQAVTRSGTSSSCPA
jgi:Flp pilus assembly protein TadG